MLQILFEQFPGFEDARLTQGADGVARVQFQLVEQATIAFNGLQGFRLNPTHTLALSYALDRMRDVRSSNSTRLLIPIVK